MVSVTVHPDGGDPGRQQAGSAPQGTPGLSSQALPVAPGQVGGADGEPPPDPQKVPREVAPGVHEITDEKGRVLRVGTMGPLQRMRLAKAVGPQNARNDVYLGTATLAYAVQAIDSELIPAPAHELGIETLVARLGDEGINAVALVMMYRMGVTQDDLTEAGGDAQAAAHIAAERRKRETVAAAKNSRNNQS
jgi:hypothetical protein